MKTYLHRGRYQYFLNWLLVAVLAVSCRQPAAKPDQHSRKESGPAELKKTKPPASFNDTLTITVPAAVFYYPDSLQLEKIRSETRAGVFKSTMHEFVYAGQSAHLVLKKYWPKIRIIEARKVRYLLFIRSDGHKNCIDLNTKNDAYGLFLFDPSKPPVPADMMNIDTDMYEYFGH